MVHMMEKKLLPVDTGNVNGAFLWHKFVCGMECVTGIKLSAILSLKPEQRSDKYCHYCGKSNEAGGMLGKVSSPP